MPHGLRRGAVLLAFALTISAALPSSTVAAPQPTTQVTASGPCGSSTLELGPGPAPGWASVGLRASSAWGPILTGSWRLHWTDQTLGTGGVLGGGGFVFSDRLSWSTTVATGRGLVTLVLDRFDVTLWWGMGCSASGLFVSAWIP